MPFFAFGNVSGYKVFSQLKAFRIMADLSVCYGFSCQYANIESRYLRVFLIFLIYNVTPNLNMKLFPFENVFKEICNPIVIIETNSENKTF